MGDDDEHVCTACGRQKQNHALSVREDGVIVAASIIDPYGDWTECCEPEIRRLREEVKQTHATLDAAMKGRLWQLERAHKAEEAIRDMLDGDCLPGCRTEYAPGCSCWQEKAHRALAEVSLHECV